MGNICGRVVAPASRLTDRAARDYLSLEPGPRLLHTLDLSAVNMHVLRLFDYHSKDRLLSYVDQIATLAHRLVLAGHKAELE